MPGFVHAIAPVIVILMMVVVGLELTVDDLARELRRPRLIVWGLALQLVALPAFTYVLGRAFVLPSEIVIGMAILAACPAGGVSNAFVQAARGNLPLSVSLTALGAIAAPVTVPLLLALGLRFGMGLPGSYSQEVPILWLAIQLSFAIFVPIGAGMAVRHYRPGWAERNRSRLSAVPMLALIGFIAASLISNFEVLTTALSKALIPAALWTTGAVAVGVALALALRLEARDALTVVIELANRNLGIALLVAAGFSDPLSVFLFPIALIAIGYPVSLLASGWFRWRMPTTTGAPVETLALETPRESAE